MIDKILNKLKKEFKSNKYTFIVLIAFVLFIFVFFALYKFLVPSSSSDIKYGNRLEGIEEVLPSNKELKEINKKIEEIDYVVSSKDSIDGKIIKFIITLKDGNGLDKAKEVSAKILENFSEDQIAYFDFEVYYENENKEASGFPIIGYKNKSNAGFSYSSAK